MNALTDAALYTTANMASRNSIRRTNIRTESYLHKNLRVSLQTLSAEESLIKIENKIEKSTKHNKLGGVRQVLLELLLCGCLDFDFGFEVFCAFFEWRPQRQYFRDSLIDETFSYLFSLFCQCTVSP